MAVGKEVVVAVDVVYLILTEPPQKTKIKTFHHEGKFLFFQKKSSFGCCFLFFSSCLFFSYEKRRETKKAKKAYFLI